LLQKQVGNHVNQLTCERRYFKRAARRADLTVQLPTKYEMVLSLIPPSIPTARRRRVEAEEPEIAALQSRSAAWPTTSISQFGPGPLLVKPDMTGLRSSAY
jgi:hypothetical protein